MNWKEPSVLIALVTLFGGIIYKLIALHLDHLKLREESSEMKMVQKQVREDVDRHFYDSSRHIDPIRDAQQARELTRRLDRLEQKLDEVLQMKRRRKQGDSDEDN